MNLRESCPKCGCRIFKKNGINVCGGQNHKCLECGKQFVLDPQNKAREAIVKTNDSQKESNQAETAWLSSFVEADSSSINR